MKPLNMLVVEIYQKLEKQYPNLAERREATKQYILNEITQWTVKISPQGDNYFFKPREFSGDKNSTPFEIRLIKSEAVEGYHELKFGNLNATTTDKMFKWDDKDPYKLQKALFLRNVLEVHVKMLFETGRIIGLMFQPYDEDGLADYRYNYFYNMYSKLGKDDYDLEKGEFEADGTYFITPKTELE
jgi:hypothetical protein